jgi:hypothetical protein
MRYLEFATIGEMCVKPGAEHFVGLPPELTGNNEMRQALPAAQVIVLHEDDQSNVFLTRFTSHGEEVGDTWHASIAEARGQAAFEYGDALGSWQPMPKGITNIVALVRHLVG